MNASTIKSSDARRIGAAVRPGLDYLRRLRERMVEVGFLPDDPLFAAVVKAHDAAGELYMALHYAGCSGGVGGARMGTAPKS
jgi:hypothetical protein